MTTSTHIDHISYHEGTYTIDIYDTGDLYMRHQCPRTYKKEDHHDYILPHEILNNKCQSCTTLNIPESLQALYYLYKYGRPDKVKR